MLGNQSAPATPCVVDNMVLAMFVDAGQATLLAALAGGGMYVTPSILDPLELPPFAGRPRAEFAKGLFEAQRDLAQPLLARRAQWRTAFYQGGGWQPVVLSARELRRAQYLASPAARAAARGLNSSFKAKRVDLGEAECAAVALERGWDLWSDDGGIVELVRTLHPSVRVERLCGLLLRAVGVGLIACEEARYLYNIVFKGELGLWTALTLHCDDGVATCK